MRKIVYFILQIAFISLFSAYAYCYGWLNVGTGWIFQNMDGTFAKGGWFLLDGNLDGIAEYYYFDENGIALTDTICPDYSIVNKDGQKLDKNGKVITEEKPIEQVIEEIKWVQESKEQFMGSISEGSIRADLMTKSVGPQAEAEKGKIVMNGVILKEEDETETASRKLVDNIVGGDKFEKSVNATVMGNKKWKDVMMLKGDGSYLIFKNPGFKKMKGRVAHEYIEDKNKDETHCCINLVIDDLDFTSIEDFDYKKYETFEFELPEDCMKVKLELIVSGDSTARKVYIRDLIYKK